MGGKMGGCWEVAVESQKGPPLKESQGRPLRLPYVLPVTLGMTALSSRYRASRAGKERGKDVTLNILCLYPKERRPTPDVLHSTCIPAFPHLRRLLVE